MTQVIGQTVLIGTLYTQPDIDPETGEYITPPVALPGWHVNIPTNHMTSALQPYAVTPGNPRIIYADAADETAYLCFPDEAQGMDALRGAGLLPKVEE